MNVPENPRVISYVDLQWWLRATKFAFDSQLPNMNPMKLTNAIAAISNWKVQTVRAYVDVPTQQSSSWWNQLWCNRITDLEKSGVVVSAVLQRTRPAWSVDENEYKKVTVRSEIETPMNLTMDVVADVALNRCDVVLLFTRETKYLELTRHLKFIAKQENRWLKIVSAFPYQSEPSSVGTGNGSKRYNSHSGIERTDWFRVDYQMYRECTDFIRKPVLDHDRDRDPGTGIEQDQEPNETVVEDGSETFSFNGGVTKHESIADSKDDDDGELSIDNIFEHSSVSEEEYQRYLRGEVEVNDSTTSTDIRNSATEK